MFSTAINKFLLIEFAIKTFNLMSYFSKVLVITTNQVDNTSQSYPYEVDISLKFCDQKAQFVSLIQSVMTTQVVPVRFYCKQCYLYNVRDHKHIT